MTAACSSECNTQRIIADAAKYPGNILETLQSGTNLGASQLRTSNGALRVSESALPKHCDSPASVEDPCHRVRAHARRRPCDCRASLVIKRGCPRKIFIRLFTSFYALLLKLFTRSPFFFLGTRYSFLFTHSKRNF